MKSSITDHRIGHRISAPQPISWTDASITGVLPRESLKFPALDNFPTILGDSERGIAGVPISRDACLAVFPTLGCFQPGYLLAVPTAERFSFAELQPDELLHSQLWIERWRRLLNRFFGDTILAEHGSSGCVSRSASCVDQAHMHLIPLPTLREKIRDRYHHDGGQPNEILRDLRELPELVKDRPYILLSVNADEYLVWLDIEKFQRQYVRRVSSEMLGITQLYNWRSHPFPEMMELTQTLLSPTFLLHANYPSPNSWSLEDIPWRTAYDFPDNDQREWNPHAVLFGDRNAERLLLFAACRAKGLAEEAIDQLRRLRTVGALSEEQGIRARALCRLQSQQTHDLNTRDAAREFLGV